MTSGLDLFFEGALVLKYPETFDQFFYGYHLAYDFMFSCFNIRAQLGSYIGDNKNKGSIYIYALL